MKITNKCSLYLWMLQQLVEEQSLTAEFLTQEQPCTVRLQLGDSDIATQLLAAPEVEACRDRDDALTVSQNPDNNQEKDKDGGNFQGIKDTYYVFILSILVFMIIL